jgi:hypothetical protein
VIQIAFPAFRACPPVCNKYGIQVHTPFFAHYFRCIDPLDIYQLLRVSLEKLRNMLIKNVENEMKLKNWFWRMTVEKQGVPARPN